jgi:hypothetical protein
MSLFLTSDLGVVTEVILPITRCKKFLRLVRLARSHILLCILGCILQRRVITLSSFQESFEVHELSLKAYVREYDVSSLPDERHCFIECHLMFYHQVCYHTSSTSRHSCKAMDKDDSMLHAFLDELDRCPKVLHQIHIGHVEHVDNLVLELLRRAVINYLLEIERTLLWGTLA